MACCLKSYQKQREKRYFVRTSESVITAKQRAAKELLFFTGAMQRRRAGDFFTGAFA